MEMKIETLMCDSNDNIPYLKYFYYKAGNHEDRKNTILVDIPDYIIKNNLIYGTINFQLSKDEKILFEHCIRIYKKEEKHILSLALSVAEDFVYAGAKIKTVQSILDKE